MRRCLLPYLLLFQAMFVTNCSSLSMNLYGIPNSSWKCNQWNWGSAVGTGHDCAMICRNKFNSPISRQQLVDDLRCDTAKLDMEEVKLVLGLAWQKARWDGRDGGRGGYGDVLSVMAQAKRYESDNVIQNAERFVEDMVGRFHLLEPSEKEKVSMNNLSADPLVAQQQCSGLVLEAMGFVEHGC